MIEKQAKGEFVPPDFWGVATDAEMDEAKLQRKIADFPSRMIPPPDTRAKCMRIMCRLDINGKLLENYK